MSHHHDKGSSDRLERCTGTASDTCEHELEEALLSGQRMLDAEIGTSASREACRLASLGWPLVVQEVAAYGSTIIAVSMVGHLGPFPLSVYSLARSVTNMTGISVLVGVTGGIDTVCSQSHGAGGHHLVGITLQRGVAITLLACLPLLALYTQAHAVLEGLGQEAELAAAAGRYIRLYSPLIPIHGTVLCVYRYLIAQGAVTYVMLSSFAYLAATAPLNWLLIFKLGLGLDGSALAAVACDAVYLAALLMFAAHHNAGMPPSTRPWQGFSAAALRGWAPYLRLAAASTLMVVLDWWIYDVCTLMAGVLPDPHTVLAGVGIAYSLNALISMAPFGLAFAVCARVGACLGARQGRAAMMAARVGVSLATGGMLMAGVTLVCSGHAAALPFTQDPAVLALASKMMLPLAAGLVGNGGATVLAGLLRGCGLQKYGAAANLFVNWGLGVPAAVFFAFQLEWGPAGLWWGLCLASNIRFLVVLASMFGLDWAQESRRVSQLVQTLAQQTG